MMNDDQTRICPMRTRMLYKDDFISDCWNQICDDINAPVDSTALEIIVAGIAYHRDWENDTRI